MAKSIYLQREFHGAPKDSKLVFFTGIIVIKDGHLNTKRQFVTCVMGMGGGRIQKGNMVVWLLT